MKLLSAGMMTLGVAALLAAAPPGRDDTATRRVTGTAVVLDTSLGVIILELDRDQAPKTVANFLGYVESGFYDGTIFHRTIDNFMIQGGGYDAAFNQKKTLPPIRNEADNGLSNRTGTLAMARTSDPHSATAQFFINVKDNVFLDQNKDRAQAGYCVFGKVVDGMDVVHRIKKVPTGNKGVLQNVPLQDVIIKSARIVR